MSRVGMILVAITILLRKPSILLVRKPSAVYEGGLMHKAFSFAISRSAERQVAIYIKQSWLCGLTISVALA